MEKVEINQDIKNDLTENRIGLLEIEEMLKNNIKPPGIMEYDDLPPETPLEPSESVKTRVKKPWENENNEILKSNIEEIFGNFENEENENENQTQNPIN